MNSKERIEGTFKKKETDRIPVNHRQFSSKAASYLLGREAFVGGGIQQWREAKSYWEGWHDEYLERSFRDAIDIAILTNHDMIRITYWRYRTRPTRKVNEYTYLYEYGEEEDWLILRYDPRSEQAVISYLRPQELTLEDLRNEVKKSEKEISNYQPSQEDFFYEIKAQGMMGKEKAIEIRNAAILGIPPENIWFQAMLLDPGMVKAFISQQVERAKKNIEFLSEFGFRYFLGGHDFASQDGPIYSPQLFQKLILPGLKEISKICHSHNRYHLFASDGNLWPVADALFRESEIDGYYEVDRRAGMDLEKLRKQFPKLTLMGNVSSWTLSQGTQEDVKQECLSCLEVARKYGGIIVGCSNMIVPETPRANAEVMIETLRQETRIDETRDERREL